MGIETKTTKQIAAENLANLESELSQESPLNDQAFLRVLSGVEALLASSLRKYTEERSKANLAKTAQGDDLINLGEEHEVILKKAQAAILDISLPAVNGTIIPQTAIFTGDNNGERYFPDNDATAAAGVALLTVTAENVGVIGNLNDSEPLTINVQIPGATTVATVVTTVTLGTEEEEQEAYRRRVQAAIRKKSGGYNTADTRAFAEAVPGVAAAFPLTGSPFPSIGTVPPERTMYVQAEPSVEIGPGGIAGVPLLDAVRDALNTDPVTGISRLPLGLTDATLFVESISRLTIFVEVRNLVTPAGQLTNVQTQVDAAVTVFLENLAPFIEGLDAEDERNDEITDLALSAAVQDVLKVNNSSAEGVGFGFAPASFEGFFKLVPGELVKLDAGGVIYV